MSYIAAAFYVVLVVAHLAVAVGLGRGWACPEHEHRRGQSIATALSVLADMISQYS